MTNRFHQLVTMLCFCVSITAMTSPAAASVSAEHPQSASPVSSEQITRWSPFIKEAARRFGIAEDWIKAVIRMESGGHTTLANGTPIISSKGAMGLMQLMPQTWRDMQREYGLGRDPYDPHDNVLAGTAYLRWLYGKFGFPEMFAAYNAGPATVDAWSADMGALPQETRAYVRGISQILGIPETASGEDSMPHDKASGSEGTEATLTRPDGAYVSIDASTVTAIRASLSGEFPAGVQTVVSMGQRLQGVLESPDKVVALLKSHGAKV
jgi:transglycosylase-like protein with SLT domain